MITRKQRFVIVILILIVCLFLAAWFFYLLLRGETTVTQAPVVEQEQEEVIPSRPTVSEVELEEEREDRSASSDLLAFSKTFIERYGSYSNEAAFANLRDVLPLMSDSFAARTQKFIDEGEVPEEYFGVTTKVLTVEVSDKDDEAGRATIEATTQRAETVESPQNESVKYQEITLTFVMEEGAWKIDSANWQ